MLTDFGRVLIFFILGAIFTGAGLVTAWLIRPSRPYAEKLSTYECGEEPVGESWVKFNIRFYVVALIFLLFEVEVVFLFPWALVFKNPAYGAFAFVEMLVFLGILVVGYAYVWVKGDLEWDKPVPKTSQYVQGVGVVQFEALKENVVA